MWSNTNDHRGIGYDRSYDTASGNEKLTDDTLIDWLNVVGFCAPMVCV